MANNKNTMIKLDENVTWVYDITTDMVHRIVKIVNDYYIFRYDFMVQRSNKALIYPITYQEDRCADTFRFPGIYPYSEDMTKAIDDKNKKFLELVVESIIRLPVTYVDIDGEPMRAVRKYSTPYVLDDGVTGNKFIISGELVELHVFTYDNSRSRYISDDDIDSKSEDFSFWEEEYIANFEIKDSMYESSPIRYYYRTDYDDGSLWVEFETIRHTHTWDNIWHTINDKIEPKFSRARIMYYPLHYTIEMIHEFMYFNPAMSEFNSNILKLMSDILAHMLICTAIDDGAKLDDSIETIFKNLMKHYNGYKMVLNKDISPERNVYYCNTDISGLFSSMDYSKPIFPSSIEFYNKIKPVMDIFCGLLTYMEQNRAEDIKMYGELFNMYIAIRNISYTFEGLIPARMVKIYGKYSAQCEYEDMRYTNILGLVL